MTPRLQHTLYATGLVAWGSALTLVCLLAWRVHRLDSTFQQMNVDSKALVKSADDLAASVKETEAAMGRLRARVEALDAGGAPIVFERR